MRSKEVDEAINIVSNVRTGLMNFNELVNGHKDIIDSVETVLNYISELEKDNNKCEYYESVADELYKNSISKDKIRDKIKELEEKFDFFAGREHAEWQDGEFDGDVCDDIALQIKVLKELLGE